MTEERRITVPRSARYFVRGNAQPRELWLACHGYGQLAEEFLTGFRAVPDDIRLIAPEALNRFYHESGFHGPESRVGATWMTRIDRLSEIDDYVRYLDLVYDDAIATSPELRVTAFGFSQGAATIARWAARTSRRYDRVVLWGAGIPPEVTPRPDLFHGAEVIFVSGLRDAFNADRAAEGARTFGLDARVLRFDGGHRLDDATLRLLAD